MHFFEQELNKIMASKYPGATYVGRACYVCLNGGLKAKLQFVTCGCADKYEALKVIILNAVTGEIDNVLIRFSDIFGRKSVSTPCFKDGLMPYIWANRHSDVNWYIYQPTKQDYASLTDAVTRYLNVFQTQR